MSRPPSEDPRKRVVTAVVGGASTGRWPAPFGVAGVVGGEVVIALSCDRLWHPPDTASRCWRPTRVHRGAAAPDAESDVARSFGF
jgi:hypothetical protein